MSRVSVAVITRDRRAEALATLGRLTSLPESPPVVVVDNGSTDGTANAVREAFPDVVVVAEERNAGAAARNTAVALASTPYVAFADDDSWWAPRSLERVAEVLDASPRVGLVCSRILVGPEERLDPTCEVMAHSPLPAVGLPGPALLGFVACGSVVRRRAFLEVGGFEPRFVIGAEEQLLAIELASAGWSLVYRDDVVAHHHPSPGPRGTDRERSLLRNELWTLWLRRRGTAALRGTARLAGRGLRLPRLWPGIAGAVRGIPWVLRARRPVPPHVERGLELLSG